MIMNFIDSLKILQNLESLTIKDKDIGRKMNSIMHLKNLCTLDNSIEYSSWSETCPHPS